MKKLGLLLVPAFLVLASKGLGRNKSTVANSSNRSGRRNVLGNSISLPRGIRNNNPGNVKKTHTNWVGKINHQVNDDGTFEQFCDMVYGIRAMIRILRTYWFKYGLTSVEGIIHRWAPMGENTSQEVQHYIDHVKKRTILFPFLYWEREPIKALVMAMAEVENGIKNPFTEEQFNRAWSLLDAKSANC